MTLKRDLSTLRQGNPPDPDPGLFAALINQWHQGRDDDRPTAAGTRLRHSDAGKCARALALKAAGFAPSDPMDEAGTWVTGLGTLIHDIWQRSVEQEWGNRPDVKVHSEVKCRIDGLDASGHADLTVEFWERGAVVYHEVLELKTTGGFSFKKAVGERGHPQGPKYTAVVQTALNALALDADVVRIGVISLEAISKQAAERKGFDGVNRFIAQWSMERDKWEPIALREVRRFARILELVDQGELAPTEIPDPEIPRGARVVEPSTGRWELRGDEGEVLDSGTTYHCIYCNQQSNCALIDNPSIVPIDIARARVNGEETSHVS